MIAHFDAFETNEVQNLTGPMADIKEFFQLFYLAEMRIAVFCAVVSVMLLGMTFMFKNKAPDFVVNKAWAIRLVLIIVLIFCIGDVVGLAWNANI